MNTQLDGVTLAQAAAQAGKRPHEILKLLLNHFEPKWPGHIPFIDIERCLGLAFNVPLRVARDIETWNGFTVTGEMTDEEIDTLLEPWITNEFRA